MNYFTKNILHWHYTQNQRQLPWKGEQDPYKIWLSEIILQQTRAEQGLKYYQNFIHSFPTITDLASAKDDVVFKMWEGLGYYNRCRNLLFTARQIANVGKGFPTQYNDILALKGVGNYTAAAIASFAYNLPYAVVDGNVYRVLSRYTGNATPIDSTEGKKHFATLAQSLLPTNDAANYNQAIMDFGATVCKPKLANCNNCILQKKCIAYQTNTVYELPVKTKKIDIKKRTFTYYIISYAKQILVHQRTENDVWKDLYEFVNMEEPNTEKKYLQQLGITNYKIISTSIPYLQKLTHQHITAQFVCITIPTLVNIKGYNWVNKNAFSKLSFPAIINNFLQNDSFQQLFD